MQTISKEEPLQQTTIQEATLTQSNPPVQTLLVKEYNYVSEVPLKQKLDTPKFTPSVPTNNLDQKLAKLIKLKQSATNEISLKS